MEPGNEQELAKVLKLANAAGLAVIPRGGGTKLGWGNPPARADMILSTARLTDIIEAVELIRSEIAGATLQNLETDKRKR